mgnify:CR=1 FL=1
MDSIIQGKAINSGLHLNNENGVTLIEVMVYLVIAGMMLGAAVMLFTGQNKTYNRQDIIAEIQQNIRGATNLMVSEIRLAGFDPATKGAGFISATANSLSFDYWEDTDGDGDYEDETTSKKIEYNLYDAYGDGGTDIGRKVGASASMPLAENIEKLRFEYLYWNYNTEVWAWANSATAIKDALGISENKALEQIRAVKIIVLGRSRPSAFTAEDTTIYKPPLEGSASETWSPAADSGDRRLMSVVVECRNIRG